jgi:putative aldouronate transport system permease protein
MYIAVLCVIASFSDPTLVSTGQVLFYPKAITFRGYDMLFSYNKIWIGYRNTILVTVFGTLFNLLVTLPAAYTASGRSSCPAAS